MSPATLTLTAARDLLRSGQISPRELVESIAASADRLADRVGGYLTLDVEGALEAADTADVSLPLGGLPIAVKDLINVRGQPCSCASRMLADGYISPYDATVIRRLRAAGAIPFGRTDMDEFAMGSSTENSALGVTRNPWSASRIPGGSSGGSAAVVASDAALAALGSDTGGSIRQPAALCGCVGLKPTYGRVSRFGLTAFASSLDQIGPLAKTVEDAALILETIAGHDPADSTSLEDPATDFRSGLGQGVAGLRIGLPREYFIEGIDDGVRAAVDAAFRQLESLGAELVEISLPHAGYAVASYYIIATAEASANLARFDGVRYGHRTANAADLSEHYLATRAEGFGDEVKRRILLGTYVLSSGYHDAYYLRAQRVRTLIREDFRRAFEQVDLVASPTSPVPAFPRGARVDDPLQMYLADVFTLAANLAGICGISVPCGFAEAPPEGDGAEGGSARLPVGLQLLGPAMAEATLLRAAHAYEQATEWHRLRPPLS